MTTNDYDGRVNYIDNVQRALVISIIEFIFMFNVPMLSAQRADGYVFGFYCFCGLLVAECVFMLFKLNGKFSLFASAWKHSNCQDSSLVFWDRMNQDGLKSSNVQFLDYVRMYACRW